MTRSIDCDNLKLANISTSPISGYPAGCTLGPPGGRMSCEQKRCIISRSEFGVCVFKVFIYGFLGALGLCCCVQAFSSCGERGYSSCSVQASHCDAFSCYRALAPGRAGSSSCGAQA